MLITGTTRAAGRRQLLRGAALGAVALVTGCQTAEPGKKDSGGSGPSPERLLRRQAHADASALLERYDAVLAAHPPLAEELGPLRTEAAAYAAAFAEPGSGPAKKKARPKNTGGAKPSAPPPAPAVPTDPREARADLAAAAKRAADAHARTLAGAPGELARLLASVSAAGTVHAYLLSKGAAE
ncbi:hypothetical protein SRB5_61810 [Streptomyces sp. RB5]|uniref:Lipoprotein n=1 Tax=Streptomyces smaragdinus TaxID=2585196 RepID=A0A7K0CRA8_9ACTN|nr:hypothetical protein [Streptomyces smaragdinus]MQY15989.1 hypothetical protein [Streptomyces smaragdinus]